MSGRRIPNVLSIAGSDPSGGAGIQADLKAFAARGVYGMAVLTALTAQNTQGVSGVHVVPAAFVADQIRAVFDDIRVDAVKIGMIADAEIAAAISDALSSQRDVPMVLDPVMIAKGGARLLAPEAVDAMKTLLLPRASVVTPNLPEAAALLGEADATSREAMAEQAARMLALGPAAVLLKGGHLGGDESPDLLLSAAGSTWLEGERIETRNTHGTGCTLSSAIAAELAKGAPIADAAATAKRYLAGAIRASAELTVGSAHGPVNHLYALWTERR